MTGDLKALKKLNEAFSKSGLEYSIIDAGEGSSARYLLAVSAGGNELMEKARGIMESSLKDDFGVRFNIQMVGMSGPEKVVEFMRNPENARRSMNKLVGFRGFYTGKELFGDLQSRTLNEINTNLGKRFIKRAMRAEDDRIRGFEKEREAHEKKMKAIHNEGESQFRPETKTMTKESIKTVKGLAVQELLNMLGHAPKTVSVRPHGGKSVAAFVPGYEAPLYPAGKPRRDRNIMIDRSAKLPLSEKNKLDVVFGELKASEKTEVLKQLARITAFLHKNGLRHGDIHAGSNAFVLRTSGGKPRVVIKDFETAGLLADKKFRFAIAGAQPAYYAFAGEGMAPKDVVKRYHPPRYGNESKPVRTPLDRAVEEMKEDTRLGNLFIREGEKSKLLSAFEKEYEREFFSDPLLFKGKPIEYWAKKNPLKEKLRGKARIIRRH